jgi:hypothetical protein
MLTAYRGVLERTPQVTHTLILASLDAFSAHKASTSAAASSPPAPEQPPVTLTTGKTEPLRLNPGTAGEAVFVLRIAPAYHVNSQKPTDEYLIPTTAAITSDLPAAVGPVTYPAPSSWQAMNGEALSVYQSEARFIVPITVTADAVPGSYHLTLTIRYQPCSDNACLAPQEQTASSTVIIE